MKGFRVLALFLSLGFLSACSNEMILPDVPNNPPAGKFVSISLEERVSLAMSHAQTLSSEEASAMLNGFLKGLPDTELSDRDFSIRLKETEYISSDGAARRSQPGQAQDIPFYRFEVVSGAGKGFAVVSGDGRCPGVVGYVPRGNLDSLAVCADASMMMRASELFVLIEVNRVQHLVDSLKDKTIEKVSAHFPDVEITEDNVCDYVLTKNDSYLLNSFLEYRRPGYSTYKAPDTYLYYNEGRHITTQWHQEAPYNGLLPQSYRPSGGTNVLGNYPLGSGVVAAMQVLGYLRPSMQVDGKTVDWDRLTADGGTGGDGGQEETDMMQALAKYVYEETNTVPDIVADIQYGPDDDRGIPVVMSSSTQAADLTAFLNRYVQCNGFCEWGSSDTMLHAIRGKHVSIIGGTSLRGTSHACIMDGYAIFRKSTREIASQYDFYIHTNMGMSDGEYAGYYRIDRNLNISAELKKYGSAVSNKNFWVISDIRPK